MTVSSEDTLTRRTVFTDESGSATAVALDPATNYVVTVAMDGFSTSRAEGVTVRAGQEASLHRPRQLAHAGIECGPVAWPRRDVGEQLAQ